MKKINTIVGGLAMLCLLLTCESCTPGTLSFIQAEVTLIPGRTNDPPVTFDLLKVKADTTLNDVLQNFGIHVVATAVGNPAAVVALDEAIISYQCFYSSRSEAEGVFNSQIPLIVKANPVGSSSSIDLTIDPFDQVAKECGGIAATPPTEGARSVQVVIRLNAMSSGGKVLTKTVTINYRDMGTLQ